MNDKKEIGKHDDRKWQTPCQVDSGLRNMGSDTDADVDN